MEKRLNEILEKLWSIKNDDKFYFMTYGKAWILEFSGKNVCPNSECKSTNIEHKEKYSFCKDCRRTFNG